VASPSASPPKRSCNPGERPFNLYTVVPSPPSSPPRTEENFLFLIDFSHSTPPQLMARPPTFQCGGHPLIPILPSAITEVFLYGSNPDGSLSPEVLFTPLFRGEGVGILIKLFLRRSLSGTLRTLSRSLCPLDSVYQLRSSSLL